MDKLEQLRIKQEQRNAERDAALLQKHAANASRRKKYYWIGGSTLLLLIIITSISFALPGKYDSFAKCLTDNGVIMYGAIDWCKYTQEQAGMFGKSYQYITYKDHTEGPEIKITPTWQINGQLYENVQSFERLSALTGCPI